MKKILILILIILIFGCENKVMNGFKSLEGNGYQTLGSVIKMNIYSLRYERTQGQPNEFIDTIEGPIDTMIFEVINGDKRVTSMRIWLNEEEIFSPSEFNQDVEVIEKRIVLPQNTNILKVRLTGSPGSFTTLNIYYEFKVSTALANPPEPDTIIDDRGDSIVLVDPYYPILPDEETMKKIEELEKLPVLSGPGNQVDYTKANTGYLITSGHRITGGETDPWRVYTITHDGLARKWTIDHQDWYATIHAHPNNCCGTGTGVQLGHWNFWRGYDCCIIDYINCGYSKRVAAVAYADAQLHEPYSGVWDSWDGLFGKPGSWVYRFYTYKWCCTSLVWRSYKEQGVSFMSWWWENVTAPTRAPTPLELMNSPIAIYVTASFD